MTWILAVLAIIIVCFGLVILVGAPYLPTMKPQIKATLKLAGLKPGDTLLELGCGDGRVVLAAAQQGIHVVGYELNPILVAIAYLRTRHHRKNVKIIWGDYWHAEWPEAEAIFVFLLSKYMKRLDKKIIQYNHKPVKLVSYAFEVPGRKLAKERSGVFLYEYT